MGREQHNPPAVVAFSQELGYTQGTATGAATTKEPDMTVRSNGTVEYPVRGVIGRIRPIQLSRVVGAKFEATTNGGKIRDFKLRRDAVNFLLAEDQESSRRRVR